MSEMALSQPFYRRKDDSLWDHVSANPIVIKNNLVIDHCKKVVQQILAISFDKHYYISYSNRCNKKEQLEFITQIVNIYNHK